MKLSVMLTLIITSLLIIGCIGGEPESEKNRTERPEENASETVLKECIYNFAPGELEGTGEPSLDSGFGNGHACETVEDCEEFIDGINYTGKLGGEISCEEVEFIKMNEIIEGNYSCEKDEDCVKFVYEGDETEGERYGQFVRCENEECEISGGTGYYFWMTSQTITPNPPPQPTPPVLTSFCLGAGETTNGTVLVTNTGSGSVEANSIRVKIDSTTAHINHKALGSGEQIMINASEVGKPLYTGTTGSVWSTSSSTTTFACKAA